MWTLYRKALNDEKMQPSRFKKTKSRTKELHCVKQRYLPEEAGHSYENEVGQEEEENSRVDIAEAHITNA
jgi:hypothetical protein